MSQRTYKNYVARNPNQEKIWKKKDLKKNNYLNISTTGLLTTRVSLTLAQVTSKHGIDSLEPFLSLHGYFVVQILYGDKRSMLLN